MAPPKFPPRLVFRLSAFLLAAMVGLVSACSRGGHDLATTIQQRGKLIAGVKYDSKPFGYLDTNGELKGFDIDLMRELARRMLHDENAVEFQQVLSSTRVIAINSGNVDIVAATMTITPDREKVIDFSRPYYTAHQTVIVPIDSPVKKLDDLNGRTILFVLGTTGEGNIKKRLPNARYTGFKTSTDAFSALKAGRGDAMTTDDTILSGFLADNCGFRMLTENLSEEPYGLGFQQSPETAALQKQVDAHLAEMEKDGTLQHLRHKWVDEALKPRACK